MRQQGWSWRWLIAIAMLLGALGVPLAAQASRGTPDSAEFAYGARVDLAGSHLEQALNASAELRLDWLAAGLDWAECWPNPADQPDLSQLDLLMRSAGEYRISVLVSITDAPDWARGSGGPDPRLTAWFITNLKLRYGDTLQAVELFPGANTAAGWGAPPDPDAYVHLLRSTRAALEEANLPLYLVAAGLTPLPAGTPGGDEDDLRFLQRLYTAGGRETMPIVSLRLRELSGDPLAAPDQAETRVLRHYEEVRRVMLANDHSDGIVWITDLSWPNGKIEAGNGSAQNPDDQALWLSKAYRQLKAQLYIGAVFFHRLNPPGGEKALDGDGTTSLIRSNLSRHPFFKILAQMTAQDNRARNSPPQFSGPQQKHITKQLP